MVSHSCTAQQFDSTSKLAPSSSRRQRNLVTSTVLGRRHLSACLTGLHRTQVLSFGRDLSVKPAAARLCFPGVSGCRVLRSKLRKSSSSPCERKGAASVGEKPRADGCAKTKVNLRSRKESPKKTPNHPRHTSCLCFLCFSLIFHCKHCMRTTLTSIRAA